MRVRQVVGSGVRRETYTLVDDDGRVIGLVDDYLALCTDREHSPNTLRARAYDLKEWLTFLRLLGIEPLAAVPEHVDQFAGWLRRPVVPGRLRAVNAEDGPSREASTANRVIIWQHCPEGLDRAGRTCSAATGSIHGYLATWRTGGR